MKDPKHFDCYRVTAGSYSTTPEHGCNGLFSLSDDRDKDIAFKVFIAQRGGWEHVCVEKFKRKLLTGPQQIEPTNEDMRSIKGVFFKDTETCVEFFPHTASALIPKPLTRHLWRHQLRDFPMPESQRKLTEDEKQEINNRAKLN